MDALILAAGFGSRLRQAEPCKPLTQIHGLSLLDISIRQSVAAGADRVIVATGYLAEAVEAELRNISARLGVDIIARRVPDFSRPNGHSILAAAPVLCDEFLLVMADHIFARDILSSLAHACTPVEGVVLAVDKRTQSDLIDPDDATWVKTDPGGIIEQIGKEIDAYDAVDCGAFLATRGLVTAIELAISRGRPGSLSDGMQVLADLGRAWTHDIGDGWWIDIDEPRSLALAREQALQHMPTVFADARRAAKPGTNAARVAA